MSKQFIDSQKALYKTFTPCYCPAIQETVHFNADGFNHLIYDRHRPRKMKEKVYRVYLVDYLSEVISKAQKAQKTSYAHPPCSLWALEWTKVQDKKKSTNYFYIKVILRKAGNGNTYFWSVMRKSNNHY